MEKTKKEVTKKPATKKETVKKEVVTNSEVTVKNQIDYTKSLNQIFYALIAICVLLVAIACINLTNADVKTSTNESGNGTTTQTEENTEYDVSDFTTLTTSELAEKIKAGGTQVVYIGRSTCGYCVKFLPILKQAQKDLGYETLYINLEEVTTSDSEILTAYDTYVEENFGYTPMVLVFKDGEFVNGWVGYTELENFESFLNEAGIK